MSEPFDGPVAPGRVDVRASLPAELTSFIGRERELAELAPLLQRSRLVTLTGPAGSGKTRLALELVAGRAAGAGAGAAVAGNVAWVELAALREPGHIAPAVAEATGSREEVGSGDVQALARLLPRGPLLLVLDNCEHLVEACAELAESLLRDCPDLTILATSREALGVRGERAWLVPALAMPRHASLDEAAASEAVRLFVARAADVVPDFELTADNAPLVVEICRRLDGIPLALELAAARVKVLSLRDIRDRLDDVFRLLTAGGRRAIPRHRTLRAAIDWSHDLLPEDGRVLLRRLSVFRGGFTLEAAERVGGGGGIAGEEVLDVLAGLVDRSMVSMREQHGTTRYFLLEALRQYSARMLTEAGEEPATRQRFVEWVASEVADAEPHFILPTRRRRVGRLYHELDNIRSALGWTREHDPALHVRLAGMLWWFWFSTQHWTEGGRWTDGALALPAAAEPGPPRARLLFAAGALAALQARGQVARPPLMEAASIAAAAGDGRLEAYALNYLSMTWAGEGSAEALEPNRRAEAWFREHDDLYGLRLALLLQGSTALGSGRLDDAERLNGEGLRVARRFGQPRELAVSLQNLATVHIAQGRLDEAEALVREAFAASRHDPSYYFIATGLGYMGEILCRRGDVEAGARFLGCAEATREAIGARAFPIDRTRQEALVGELRASAGAAFDRAWHEGRRLEPLVVIAEQAATPAAPGHDAAGPAHDGAATARTDTAAARHDDAAEHDAAARNGAAAAQPHAGVAQGGAAVAHRGGTAAGTHATGAAGLVTTAPHLLVRALGPLIVEVDGERIEAERWPYGKPRELLLFLLLREAGATRDQAGEALWPGATRANVKNSFHVTLHHVRKALGRPEWIIRETDRYRFDARLRISFDAHDFEAAARVALRHGNANGAAESANGAPAAGSVAALDSARGMYRGDLLEGESCGRWIDDDRDRLRRLFLELSLALGSLLEEAEPDRAASLYESLVLREELDEELHRRLMRLRARSGDRVRALRQYERLLVLLRDALDADPEPETIALFESIRGGRLTA